MHDEIHVVVDRFFGGGTKTALKDDQRCHILRLIIRHGDLEWQDGERSLAELFGMVDATGKLPIISQPPIGVVVELFTKLAQEGKKVIMLTVDSVCQRYLSDRLRCCTSGNG